MKSASIICILNLVGSILGTSAFSQNWEKIKHSHESTEAKSFLGVQYTRTENHFVTDVWVKKFTDSFQLGIKLTKRKHIALLNDVSLTCDGKKQSSCVYDGNDYPKMADFLRVVNNMQPLHEIIIDLSKFHGISALASRNIIFEFVHEGKIAEAIEYATKYGDVDLNILWELGENFRITSNFTAALTVYEKIKQSNPHFADACRHADAILVDRLANSESIKDQIETKKLRLKFSLGSTNSLVAAQLYEELYKVKLSPEARLNFRGDYHTLIAVAEALKQNACQ